MAKRDKVKRVNQIQERGIVPMETTGPLGEKVSTKTIKGKKNVSGLLTENERNNITVTKDLRQGGSGTVETTGDGSQYKGTTEAGANSRNLSPRNERLANRVAKRKERKEARLVKRGTRLGIKRGLGPEQAREFMQNRRNRLNQALTAFTSSDENLDKNLNKIEDRYYRKNPKGAAGPGTIQAMDDGKGGTFDASSPYKGTAALGYRDRGMARETPDKYEQIIGKKAGSKIPIAPVIPNNKVPDKQDVSEDQSKKDVETSLKDTSDGRVQRDRVQSKDVPQLATVDTIGNGMSNITGMASGANFFDSPKYRQSESYIDNNIQPNIDPNKTLQDINLQREIDSQGISSRIDEYRRKANNNFGG